MFVEYGDFEWREWIPGKEYRAPATINLHVVTEWGPKRGIVQFRLFDKIHETVMGLSDDKFVDLDIQSSQTNHNHEQLVENIETYKCVAGGCFKFVAAHKQREPSTYRVGGSLLLYGHENGKILPFCKFYAVVFNWK